jgi:hypothetical protein
MTSKPFFMTVVLAGLILSASMSQGAPADRFLSIVRPGLPQGNSAGYDFRYIPGQGSDPSGNDPIITQQGIRGSWTVVHDEKQAWMLSQTAAHTNLSASPQIPAKSWPVPDSLWDIQTGATYKRLAGAGREWTVNLTGGSASDKPYHSLNETTVRLSGVYRLPSGKENSWLFLLDYANNRGYLNNIVLPGVLYSWQKKEMGLSAVVGFPVLALSYKPDENWNASASLFGPRRFNSEISRRVTGPLRVYAGFDWTQEEWLRANRDDNKNRLVYGYKKWTLGLRSSIWKAVSLDVSGGREFDRSFFENRSTKNPDNSSNQLYFPGSWYGSVNLSWRTGR